MICYFTWNLKLISSIFSKIVVTLKTLTDHMISNLIAPKGILKLQFLIIFLHLQLFFTFLVIYYVLPPTNLIPMKETIVCLKKKISFSISLKSTGKNNWKMKIIKGSNSVTYPLYKGIIKSTKWTQKVIVLLDIYAPFNKFVWINWSLKLETWLISSLEKSIFVKYKKLPKFILKNDSILKQQVHKNTKIGSCFLKSIIHLQRTQLRIYCKYYP